MGARAGMQGRAILLAPLQGCEHKLCPDSTTDKPGVEHVVLEVFGQTRERFGSLL